MIVTNTKICSIFEIIENSKIRETTTSTQDRTKRTKTEFLDSSIFSKGGVQYPKILS